MCSRILPSLALLFVMSAPLVAAADDAPDLVTDRPDATESTEIVPRGWFQAELGFGDEDMGELLGTGLARIGLGGNVELRLGIDETDGDEDFTLGAKVKLLDEKDGRPALALIVQATENDATDARPAFRLAFADTLSERLSLGYNAGVAWDEDPSTGSLTSRLEWTAALGIAGGERHGFFVEAFGDSGLSDDGDSQTSIDGGVTWLLRPNVQLDLFAGAGLSSSAPDWFAGAGVSFRLPR